MIFSPFILASLTLLLSFGLTFILTSGVTKFLRSRSLLDIPNERSSHISPVPRGGGWAVTGTLCIAFLVAMNFFDTNTRHISLLIAFLLLVLVSGLDDRRGLNPALRLMLHLCAATLASFAFSPDALLFGGFLPFWLDRLGMIIGWAWFINLYNFMDGIDGITSIETASIALGCCLVIGVAGSLDIFLCFLTLVLSGASFGFLCHNWHPAKIFLGDVGSIPLGFIVGFCLISIAVKGYLVPALILPLYYVADSGITLFKRAYAHQKIWQAHREHFYQKAALGLGRHDTVVIFVLGANICLIAAAIRAVAHPISGLLTAVLIVAVLLEKMHKSASLTQIKS